MISPMSPGPSGPIFRIDQLAAETCLELLGVRTFGETEDVVVGVVATERVSARTERTVFTIVVDRAVFVPDATVLRQRDLVRPVAIDLAFAQLALAVDHDNSWSARKWSPPASNALRPSGVSARTKTCGRREVRCSRVWNKQGTQFFVGRRRSRFMRRKLFRNYNWTSASVVVRSRA